MRRPLLLSARARQRGRGMPRPYKNTAPPLRIVRMNRAYLLGMTVALSGMAVVLAEPTEGAKGLAKKPAIVTTKEWGSDPSPIDESRKQIPKWVTIHHAGETWWNDKDPAKFVKAMQEWGKKRPQIEKPPRDTYWP